MDARDLIENTHATNAGSSGGFHHEVRRYEGDENAHCDDGEEWRDGVLFHDDVEWCGVRHALSPPHALVHAVEHAALRRDHAYLNDSYSGDDEKGYVQEGYAQKWVGCGHSN
jgi:hypothetical protein